MRARLDVCDAPATALIEATAILGDGTPLMTVSLLADLTEPGAAIDQAIDAKILSSESSDRLDFVHPLTRSVVFHTMGRARRSELHRVAADLLEVTDSASSLDHRVVATVAIDAALAADIVAQAEIDAATGSWATAAERFRVPPGPSPNRARDRWNAATLGMVDCLALEGDMSMLGAAEESIGNFDRSASKEYAPGRLRGLAVYWLRAKNQI